MQIPKYDYTQREWDRFKYFHNDIDGPFYLLETGEVVVTSSDYHMVGKYPEYNVQILQAPKLTRTESKPHVRFEYFRYPEGVDMPSTYVPYNQLSMSDDHYFMIDYDTKRVHPLTRCVTELGALAVPYYLTDDRITRSIVAYIRPEKDGLKQSIIAHSIRLKIENKISKDVRSHMHDAIAASKAWLAMSDVRRLNRTRQRWTDYYSYTDAKGDRQTLVPEAWGVLDLYDNEGKRKLFTDIAHKTRLSMAVRKPDKCYSTKVVDHLIYDGPDIDAEID